MSQNYVYTSSKNFELDITTYGNSNLKNSNCIIFAHGFKGFKDWGFVPYFGKYFSDKGYFVITFNFSHNGVATGSKDFDDLDKFANNTLSLEKEELNEIINAYKNGFFGEINSTNKIGLVGHSRGGAISILASGSNENIDVLVTWAAISKLDRFTDRQKIEWKANGFFEVLNSRTNQIMRININLLNDIENFGSTKLNLKTALSNFNKPYLIIHGDQDLTVPFDEAEDIYFWSDKSLTELYKIKGAGHTFDIKHPFESITNAFNLVLEKTNSFFQNHLQS